jgi:hypothetical protein
MSYRDDLDALTARQASLEAELGRKQRELAQVTGLIAEARQVEQAESHFERAPDLRRSQKLHLVVGALVLTLGSGAAVGAAAATAEAPRPQAAGLVRGTLARLAANRVRLEQARRLHAELEALRTLHLIPMVAPNAPNVRGLELAQHSPPLPAWILGSGVPVRGSLWTGSLPGKDQR